MRASPGLASPFLAYRYALVAEEVFPKVRVARIGQDGRVAAFFVIQYKNALHQLFGIGQRLAGELSDYFGLVAKPGFQITPPQLLSLCGLSSLYFTHLDEGQVAWGLSGEQPEPGVQIAFPDGGPAFWEVHRQKDKKFTSDTERRERKLIESHGPLRFIYRHSQPEQALEELIAAKRAQYARTGVKDSLAAPQALAFLRALARDTDSDPDCHAVLSTLHAGEEWVASHFGLRSGGTLHYWFPVYNPHMRAFAPGRLLVKAILQSAAETGLTMIDRGSGDSPAKLDFATSKHYFQRGLWSRPGLSSALYRAGLSAQWRLQALRSARDDRQADKSVTPS